MVDIWSSIGVELSKATGEWLYRVGDEVRGPVPIKALAEKLIRGEIPLTTPVALEGGDFHPVVQVKAFSVHVTEAKKAARKRAAAKVRRIVLISLLVVLAGGGIAGYFVFEAYKKDEQARVLSEKKRQDEERRKEEERLALGKKMDLVALVSLGTEEEVKIKNKPGTAHPKTPTKTKPGEAPASAPAEAFVSDCTRSQGDILSALGKHVSKLNACVVLEKNGPDGKLLPSTLEIEFVVVPSGKVVDFGITDRHYRTGTLRNCMAKVFQVVTYPTAGGSNCPVTLPLKIGG